jgi:ABC-type transport system involved in multi-copper enzyme maturation permease subunit
MTFLPIVERELRIAARRHFTYWLRLGAAAFMLLIFGGMLMISSVGPVFPWSAGQMQFTTLKWLAFVFASATGVFLTSDSLSEEKREGTLGLLFLTDLRGYDVVLGKLMSNSLQALYSLLAAFPILALPLLVGGVTGTEFARSLLVIGNTLFLSLAIGMLVSSVSREVMKAMNVTLLLILFFLVGLPWVDLGLAHWDNLKFKCILSVASPGYLFAHEGGLKPPDFWFQLGLQHLLGWLFLAAAALCIPRAWQEKTTTNKGPRQSISRWWRYGGLRSRKVWRSKVLTRDPILWLALRDRWMTRLVWLAMAVAITYLGDSFYRKGNSQIFYNNSRLVEWFLALGVVLWIGSQACRMFVDSIRNGAMELILVTPVTPREVVRGQWTALWRTFLIPVLLLIGVQSLHGVEIMRNLFKSTAGTRGVPGFNMNAYELVTVVTGVVTLLGNLLAVAWFGMWMGVTSRKTSIAVLKTISFVVVLPWLVAIFVQIGGMMAAVTWLKLPFWTSSIIAAVLELMKNIFFIAWSRHQLLYKFRDRVARGGQGIIVRAPASLPRIPAPAAPPVIS